MARKPPAIVGLEDVVETVNAILYGDPGTGKTVQAGTLPNALFLSTDVAGTTSAKRQGSKAKLWPIKEWADLQAAYEWLSDTDPKEHGFEWVIIDTGTRMQDLCIQDILGKAHEENISRSLDIPAIQDHQAWQNRFKRFIDLFVALPINTLFVFHVMTVEDEDGEEIALPGLSGGKTWITIARSMPAKVSIVGYMQTKTIAVKEGEGDNAKKVAKTVRRIHWAQGKNHFAKDRYDCLPRYTDDVPLNKIMERVLTVGQTPIAQEEDEAPATPAPPRKAAARKAAPRRAAKATKAAAPVTINPDDEEDDD